VSDETERDTLRALWGAPLADARSASTETRFALLDVEALHVGELVLSGHIPETRALPGLMRHARALRLFSPEAAESLGSLTLQDVVLALLHAAIGRELRPAILEALGGLVAITDLIANSPRGQRLDRLADGARTVGRFAARGAIDEFFAHGELMRAAEKAGLTAAEASRVIADGIEAGQREPAGLESGPAGGSNA
jgi:predicted transcriptional regulator